MNRLRKPAQAGLTLIELMVVVSIVGIISASAAVMIQSERDPGTVATALAAKLRECSRLAIRNGAPNPTLGETARARILISTDAASGSHIAELELLKEDEQLELGYEWGYLGGLKISPDVMLAGWRNSPDIDGLGIENPFDGSEDVVLACKADGTITGKTLYLSRENEADPVRLVIMPLSGETIILPGFEPSN